MKRLSMAAIAAMSIATFSFANEILGYAGWDGVADEIGSKVTMTIDSVEHEDYVEYTKVSALVEKTASTTPDAYDAYASFAAYYGVDYGFASVTGFTVSYSSDKDVWFTLPMPETSDAGTSWGIVLPAGDNQVKECIIADFAQPSWVETDQVVALDLSKVSSLSFEENDAPVDASTFTASITSVDAAGVDWGDVAIGDFKSISTQNSVVMGISHNTVKLAVPASGSYDVSIYSANGRVIQSVSSELVAGSVNDITLADQSTGVYFVQVVGSDFNVTEKVTLK